MVLEALIGAVASRDKLGSAIAGGFIDVLIGTLIDTFSEPEAKYIEE